MPEKAGDKGGESWTQTLITVTPEEDASIRGITESTVISAIGDDPLVLGVNEVADRWKVQIGTIRQDLFIDTGELEKSIIYNDVECQTILQGIPKVELPSVYSKDEASQTMYLGKISPLETQLLKNMAGIMNDKIMPASAKVTEVTQTLITFETNALKDYIVDHLANKKLITDEIKGSDFGEEKTAGSTCVTDNLNFILERVAWLSDPDYSLFQAEMKDETVQTFIKYDYSSGKIVIDADTQTFLTCEPKRSNTGLLSEWLAKKEFVREIIDDCLEAGIIPRAIVNSILDEVVENCAGQIHLPYEIKAVQTFAPCNALEDKDDVVLKKLRLAEVPDTLETTIIVLPLVRSLLERTCLEVSENATTVVREILERIQNNSVSIATRLAAIRQEVESHKPMDHIFEARKKRLRELLRNKISAKLCSSTQTELAGVPDIRKLKEPKETVCSTCMRHSECYVCQANLDNEDESPANRIQDDTGRNKMVRTQDILIAYNPCYVVTTPSKLPKNHHPALPERMIVKPPVKPVAQDTLIRSKPELQSPICTPSSCKRKNKRLDDVCTPGSRSLRSRGRGSLCDWARVVQEASSISCGWSSIRGSSSTESNVILKQVGASSKYSVGKSHIKGHARSQSDLSRRSVDALRILKNTFNRKEDSCTDCSYNLKNSGTNTGDETTECREKSSVNSKQVDEKIEELGETGEPYTEGVRVVPIIYLSN